MNRQHVSPFLCYAYAGLLVSAITVPAAAGIDLCRWQRTLEFPVNGFQYDPVEYNHRIYVLGGYDNNTGVIDAAYVGEIGPNESIASWSLTTPLPEPDQGPGVTVWNGPRRFVPRLHVSRTGS
jgi:hypothetical protein